MKKEAFLWLWPITRIFFSSPTRCLSHCWHHRNETHLVYFRCRQGSCWAETQRDSTRTLLRIRLTLTGLTNFQYFTLFILSFQALIIINFKMIRATCNLAWVECGHDSKMDVFFLTTFSGHQRMQTDRPGLKGTEEIGKLNAAVQRSLRLEVSSSYSLISI